MNLEGQVQASATQNRKGGNEGHHHALPFSHPFPSWGSWLSSEASRVCFPHLLTWLSEVPAKWEPVLKVLIERCLEVWCPHSLYIEKGICASASTVLRPVK